MLTFPLEPLWIVFVGGLGLIFGSFVTALSHRLPRGENIATGRSKCPKCGTALGVADLVPVMSWLMTRGRCRHCGATISGRYPAIEAITGLMCIGAGVAADTLPELSLLVVTAPVLVCIAVIDLEHQRVPNVLVMIVLLLMMAWRALTDGGAASLATGVALAVATWIGFVLLNWAIEAWARMTVIGPGDSKLIAVAAVAAPAWSFVVFAGLLGAIALFFGLIWQAAGRRPEFPLAPSFALALWIVLLVPGLGDRFAA